MKKTLVALSILASLPMLAQSSEVTVYGKVDVGLAYTSIDHGLDGLDRTDKLQMMSGQTAGSRVGMRGYEDLGGGNKVGFILETGFNVDTGALGQGGRIFGRQAVLYVDGAFGNLKLGQQGALMSGYPDTGLFGGNMSPFAVGLGEVAGHRYLYSSEDKLPMDNTITYTTPKFAGWQVMLQYSGGMDAVSVQGEDFKSSVDRYAAAALHFDNKNTEFNLAVDWTNFRSYGAKAYQDPDDGVRVTFGVRHGVSFGNLYAGAQYFKDSRHFTQDANQFYGRSLTEEEEAKNVTKFLDDESFGKDGYGINLGIDYFALGGTVKGQVGYMHAERSDDSSVEMKRWFVSAGYWYDFSKRTTLYSGISYIRDSLDGGNYSMYDDASCIAASLGLVHNF